jgi:hypothetical protein
MSVVDRFITELLASEFAPDAHQIHEAIVALDREGDSNPSAAGLYEAVVYVVGHRDHSLGERLAKLDELIHRKGLQRGTLRQLVGW